MIVERDNVVNIMEQMKLTLNKAPYGDRPFCAVLSSAEVAEMVDLFGEKSQKILELQDKLVMKEAMLELFSDNVSIDREKFKLESPKEAETLAINFIPRDRTPFSKETESTKRENWIMGLTCLFFVVCFWLGVWKILSFFWYLFLKLFI